MASLSPFNPNLHTFLIAFFLLFLQTKITCYQFKVGDLDSWGIPSSLNPQIYINWSKKTHLQIGDSLLFLYPPSQDSVIQVTAQAFKSCNTSNPILYMDNGNSVFNLTTPGTFYFTSGVAGHCQKHQKLEISVGSTSGDLLSPSYAPTMLPDTSPSYTNVFGSIPSFSPPLQSVSVSIVSAVSALGSVMILVWF